MMTGMKDATIPTARMLRTQLEIAIGKLLDEYMQRTTLPIESIDVTHIKDQLGRVVTHAVSINVKL
jgi:hypothetical protein